MDSVRDAAGEIVTYCRNGFSVTLSAVPGSSPIDTSDTNDIPIMTSSRDWILKVSDLVIGGCVIIPQRGDLIKQTIAGKTVQFEVLSDGNQEYHYCDRARTRIRVHTKEKHG
jgi:hypothetical protein